MQKAISVLMLGAAFLSLALCACDVTAEPEATTDINEKIIAAIDSSSPVTKGNLITKTKTNGSELSIEYYDNNGNLVENYVWEKDAVKAHTVMTYSDTNKLLTQENLTPSGTHSLITSYQYDENDELQTKTINEFEDGFLTKSTSYNADNEITGYSLTYYNDAQRLSKIERYNEEDDLQEYFMYEYDSDGRTSKYSSYSADGVLKKYTTFQFNDDGLPVEEKYYNGSHELQDYYLFEYYDSGAQKTSSHYDSTGSLISQDTFEDTTQ